MWVNEGTPTMSFVLYTINVECMCDASYVTWKYRQYRRYHVIFARKYKTLQNVNILGARFNSSGTSFFENIWKKIIWNSTENPNYLVPVKSKNKYLMKYGRSIGEIRYWVCLFVWRLMPHTTIFYSCGDVVITVKDFQIRIL